jgi:hypothetical protein
VVGKLPVWIVGLVVAAGIALGALLFLPRWLAKRSDPAYSPRRSFVAFALAGALGMVGFASLPVYYLAFWVQSGPTAVPLATLSNGQKTVVFQGARNRPLRLRWPPRRPRPSRRRPIPAIRSRSSSAS